MKVAVCVSGAFRSGSSDSDLVRNNKRLQEKFPTADFFYATWKDYVPTFNQSGIGECVGFDEPIVDYHPYYDIDPKNYITPYYKETFDWIQRSGREKRIWSSHHTKQILAHAMLVDTIPTGYDVIVRTRYDAFIWKGADFAPYIEDTVTHQRANCFAVTRRDMFDQLYDSDPANDKMKVWMLDQLIIHPANMFDTTLVRTLNDSRLLHAAEYGWYQVLSRPYGSNHQNRHGWVNHDRNIDSVFLKDQK